MKRYRLAAVVFSWFVALHALADERVGRLFYTLQQRLQIDRQHKPAVSHAQRVPSKDAHYNGYVMRSDGVNTIWVNGQTRYVDHAASNPGQLKLPATPALKPGQAFDRQAGRVLESYELAQPAAKPVVQPPPLTLPPLADERDDAPPVQVDNVAAH